MTDDELRRDPVVARALEDIEAPGYEPGFWDRLGARLEHEGAPGLPAEVPEVEPIDLPAPVPLPALAERRRDRRRSLVVLAAAAAAVLAIVAVQLGEAEPDGLQVAGERDGGTQLAPDDGTTSPDGSPEQDGARRPGDDDDGPDDATDDAPADRSDAPSGGAQILLSPTSTVVGGVGGTGPSAATALRAPKTAQEAFVTWAEAIDRGDVETAVALTGPRTIGYYEALGAEIEDVLASSGEGWGVWADPDGRRVRPVELGEVDGERAVGLVLDRPDPADDDADVRVYDAVPVVRGDQGWKVEFAAFDPSRDGRIEMISPAPGADTQDLPDGEVIRIAAQRTGEYYLDLDDAESTRIPAAKAVGGEIRWDPSGLHTSAGHLLVVAHLDEGQVTMLVRTFQTRPG